MLVLLSSVMAAACALPVRHTASNAVLIVRWWAREARRRGWLHLAQWWNSRLPWAVNLLVALKIVKTLPLTPLPVTMHPLPKLLNTVELFEYPNILPYRAGNFMASTVLSAQQIMTPEKNAFLTRKSPLAEAFS
jgi:hypothetical protein